MRHALRVLALSALVALCAAAPAAADWNASGRFAYVDRPFGPSGFLVTLDTLPVRFAVVQVVDAGTGSVLGSAGTDSLGRFSFRVTDGATRSVYCRALAYAADSTRFPIEVHAVDQSGGFAASGGIYAVASSALASHAPDADVDFAPGGPLLALPKQGGEPFNILDCLERGFDYEAYLTGGTRSTLRILALWTPDDVADPSYSTSHHIEYSGGQPRRAVLEYLKDDGYSDTVINHEQGHYVAATLSRDDSPGGTHYLEDSGQDLALSWSEGWATFFSLSIRRHFQLTNPTWYCDLFSEAAAPGFNFSYEIETPSIRTFGASSEVSVQAALWDIVDDASVVDVAPGVDDDSLALPDASVWDVVHNYLPHTSGSGPNRTTLEKFWDGWFARGLGHPDGMRSAFELESIEFYPDSMEDDDFASRAGVAPTAGELRHHTFYPAGDVDWIRFDATAGQSYVVESTGLIGGCITQLQLYGSDTTAVLTTRQGSSTGDHSARISFTPSTSGTYYVRCTQIAPNVAYGSYDLRVLTGTVTQATFTDVTAATGAGNGRAGRGVAWGDFDNDGYPDAYVCNVGSDPGTGAPDRLYRNSGGLTFTDVALARGVAAGVEQHEGAAWGDYDNDGNLDLAVSSVEGIHLFHNSGPPGYTFTEVTSAAGLTAGGSGRTLNWVDVDRDGYVDLYVTNYGFANQLWHNNHNGTFTPVTLGVEYNGFSLSSAWCDYDNDGRPDLALGLDGDNDPSSLKLFHQKPDGTFEDVTVAAGLSGVRGRMFGVAWGDYDADGKWDLAVANESGATLLYRNRGDGTFEETSASAGTRELLSATSPAWVDVDDDGDLDLYMVNLSNPASLFDNLNDRQFTLSGVAGVAAESRAVGTADYDRDGAEDLYISTQSGNALLRGVRLPGTNYLELRLVGRESNRTAIGGRARVTTGSRSIWREVNGGQAWGSQPDAMLHFGLGAHAVADSVVVYWPSGRVTGLAAVPANREVVIDEDSGSVTPPPVSVLLTSVPNPFNISTRILFDVPEGAGSQPVTVSIYGVNGRLERTLYSGPMTPGASQIVMWDGLLPDGEKAASGIHFCKVTLGSSVRTRKLMLLR